MSAAPPVYDPRSTQYTTTTLTPYLQLSHLLSLTWLAYPILSLLFVAFRLQLSSASASDAVANAKDDLLTSCKAAEKAATAAASMPRYMAAATNARIADTVNGTMHAARAALVLALTVMEAIINFIVDMYRSTFLCFLELVVRGALSILLGAVNEFNNFLTSAFSGLRSSIQSDIDGVNKVIAAADKILPSGLSIPSIPVPDLSALQNVTLPTDFTDALQKLNNSLPTVSDLKSKIDDIIDTPFEAVKKDINDTFAGLSFDASTLPVPEQNTVSFCGQMDTSVVDDLGRDLVKITKIGTVILVLVALLLIGANCALEWYKWRCLQAHMEYTREAWTSDPSVAYTGTKAAPTVSLSNHNLMLLSGNMQHPLLTKIANRIAKILRFSPSQYINLTWFFHYVFHPPALACFLIGFFGLLSVEIQLIAIGPLEHRYSQQAAASVNDFSNTISTSINASMYNQSAAYATSINTRVDNVQSTVNDGLFGWVNGTTTTLNNTLNTFYTDIQDAVNTVFNGTILEEPVQEFVRCFIGSKVDAIETALTFLHDNLVIDIPRVNDSVLVLSPDDVNEAVRPIATAAIGGGDGNSQGVVGKLVNAYVASLKKERIMFGIFIGLWAFVVLMALAVIFWHAYGRDWREAYKKRRWQRTQRSGIEGIVVPFRERGSMQSGGNLGREEKGDLALSPTAGKTITLAPYPQGRNPAFEKSWDSFLDGADAEEKAQPRRTLARWISIRKTQSPTDKEAPQPTSNDEEQPESWLQRLPTIFRRKDPQPDSGSPPPSPPRTRTRTRPQLTITTTDGASRALSRTPSPAPVPSSAWSVSPRRRTWLPAILSRAAPPTPPPAQPPFAVPLHHGLPLRPLPPPPPPPAMQYPAYGAVSPVYTLFPKQEDPFATPFDDEHAPSGKLERRAPNPFVAM